MVCRSRGALVSRPDPVVLLRGRDDPNKVMAKGPCKLSGRHRLGIHV